MWKETRIRQNNGNVVKGLLLLVLLVLSWILSVGIPHAQAAMLQKGISREVLRFHVLANSDSLADQEVKLKVRDDVLRWLEQELTEEEQGDLVLMEQKINKFTASLSRDYFPEKTYGDCTFPAGIYTALRICLGEAQGQNWWCVLFPRLCFMDCVHAVLPEQSQEELKNVLTEEEYESLFDPAKDEYRICFRYF